MFIDFGGAKNAITLNGKWKLMDLWHESDIVYNFSERSEFPLEDNSVEAFYSSHTFEHIGYKNIPFILNEMHRTLVPNGRVRIVVPDFEKAIEYYLHNQKKLSDKRNPGCPSFFPNTAMAKLFSWVYTPDHYKDGKVVKSGHKCAFDFETLSHFLKKANFKNIESFDYQDCGTTFAGKEDGYYSRYADYSLYVEAQK